MLSNCEKMAVMSSTRSEWPQSQTDDQMASSGRMMEKPSQDLIQQQQQQQQQALKCPRCDSSNTKFCYYNNYSLSQPRHFCKSCKRYWTRGGTLRNVPVGGGCRKNKRVRRTTSNSAIDSASSPSATSANSNPTNSQPQITDNIIASTSNHINPMFYGLSGNSSDMNFPFSRFNSRVSGVESISAYDLQPQLNALGFGFSTGILSNEVSGNNGYRNGFGLNDTLFSSYSNSAPISSPVMAALLSSTFPQQKFVNGGMTPLEDMQIAGNNRSEAEMGTLKEVKVEEQGQNRLEWINNTGDCQDNQMEQRLGLSDPNSSLYWNAAMTWSEQTHNIGSSVLL